MAFELARKRELWEKKICCANPKWIKVENYNVVYNVSYVTLPFSFFYTFHKCVINRDFLSTSFTRHKILVVLHNGTDLKHECVDLLPHTFVVHPFSVHLSKKQQVQERVLVLNTFLNKKYELQKNASSNGICCEKIDLNFIKIDKTNRI